ncbi:MAG: sigma 54-interacting transcriptional regulator [Planctomycetes bacterium]|nr:sigma 54-interacting transcriptional regulator [Planctomycetota bacterium]
MIIRVACALARAGRAARAERVLEDRGVVVARAPADEGLLEWLERAPADLVLVEARALAGRRGASLADLRAGPDHPEVVVFVEREDAEARARLLAQGAVAVVYHGVSDAALREALLAFVARRREDLQRRVRARLLERRSGLDDFASDSPAMTEFLAVVRRVVDAETSLLLLGETGVGKEHLARAIHEASARRSGPFMAVNCAALPEALLESELFGHVAGAFTGAVRDRRGYFELADGGTLFLDEVGELPGHLQVKLLRALQERAVVPVGGERALQVDVRLMAATNRDLQAEVRQGRFRSDLFYRLAVVSLLVPPLRERRVDVPRLAQRYVEHYRRRLGKSVQGVRADALDLLVRHDWPGNVRELINVIERAVLLATGDEVTPADLPVEVSGPRAAAPVTSDDGAGLDGPWLRVRDEALRDLERRYFTRLMTTCRGRVGAAARAAGLSPRSLFDALRRTGLRREAFRNP